MSMIEAFGFLDGATELGDYCRSSLTNEDNNSYHPESQNDVWEIHKKLKINNDFVSICDKIDIFHQLAALGYRLREEPTLIRWTFQGKNRGAADHYHHDGHFGKGGQVSLMLLLEQNEGMTHMRVIPNSGDLRGRKFYDLLWKIPFKGRGVLFGLNDWLLERFNNFEKLEGPKDRLYYFNAGDNLHKACPIPNTTRDIFHLNFTLFESHISREQLNELNVQQLSEDWQNLLGLRA